MQSLILTVIFIYIVIAIINFHLFMDEDVKEEMLKNKLRLIFFLLLSPPVTLKFIFKSIFNK